MQLDIFEHSGAVMVRNDVIHALEQRDAQGARVACNRLSDQWPLDEALPALLVLTEALERREHQTFARHEDLGTARQTLENVIRPAAIRTFGDKEATQWLAGQWEDLARRAEPLPFRADHADEHAAALWLQASRWHDAVQVVNSIESWRRIPAPLAWMSQARLHLFGLQATWPMLAELAWLSPRRLAELVPRSPDPLLPQLVRRFEADFEGAGEAADLAWFPAWVLAERPQLAEHLAAAQASQHSSPEQAMRLLVELLGLEHQGRHHDIVEKRKTLRELHPSLYAAYMKTR
ncbi:MAG: hypothetical protein JF606_06210 [Burkholderiales bacterium]|jgi:hypothetical protein|nr:hypothetical protein [Burkholderiales bacterium]